MEDRNLWNAFARCLSLIKGEYGRNATLKDWINRRGGGGVLGFWRGRGGCLKVAEGARSQLRSTAGTNLPHVL